MACVSDASGTIGCSLSLVAYYIHGLVMYTSFATTRRGKLFNPATILRENPYSIGRIRDPSMVCPDLCLETSDNEDEKDSWSTPLPGREELESGNGESEDGHKSETDEDGYEDFTRELGSSYLPSSATDNAKIWNSSVRLTVMQEIIRI